MSHAHAFGTPCHPSCPRWGRPAVIGDWFATATATATRPTADTTTPAAFPARYDSDDKCTGCAEHIADPCAPQCPRTVLEDAAESGAEVMTAADILDN